jgi:hypothetical protein
MQIGEYEYQTYIELHWGSHLWVYAIIEGGFFLLIISLILVLILQC